MTGFQKHLAHVRVVDESGEDYLHSQDRFVSIELPEVVRKSLANTH